MRGTGTLLTAGFLVLLAGLLVAGTAAGVTTTDAGTGPTTTGGADGIDERADRTGDRDTEGDTDDNQSRDGGVSTVGEPPLADAGLDQTVPRGTTVYLDGGGSVGLNASLTGYSWEIERPDGSITAPACDTNTCVRASFVPGQLGTYAVTLTVTDDGGESATDTLYVFVEERNPPTARVTGPDRLATDEQGTFVLTATAGEQPLSSIRWTVDGTRHNSSFVDGGTRWELNHTFSQPGTHTVGGTVTDVLGLEASDRHAVAVGPGSGPLFLVEITGTGSPVVAGEPLAVDAVVTNAGNQSATQTIALETFTGDTPDSTAVSLVPGGNTTVSFEWNTTGEDVGDGPVTVTTENDTDSDPVTIVPGNGTFFGVTDIDYSWPGNENGSISYAVTYENFGSDPGNQTVTVAQPGESRTLGSHPLQLDAGESVTRSYEWKPGGGDGWHDSAGEDVLVVARTGDHDRGDQFPVPELPTFEVNFSSAHVNPEGALPSKAPDSAVGLVWLTGVEVTNTGGVAGSRSVEFWANTVFGTQGKVDQLQHSSFLPNGLTLDPGENYSIDSYSTGYDQMRWPTSNAFTQRGNVQVKTPSDVETINVSWRYVPGSPSDPCTGGESIRVDHAPYETNGRDVTVTVIREYCDNGDAKEEVLSPSQYSISYFAPPSEAGSAYFSAGSDSVRGTIPQGYDDVGFGFTVSAGSLTTSSGVRWFRDRDDIPGG